MRRALVLLAAIAIALLRVMGHKSEAFQAIAHLEVGGLFGAWFATRDRGYLGLALALTLVEVICFLLLP